MYHLQDAYWLAAFAAALAAFLGALIYSSAALPRLILGRLDAAPAASLLRAFWPRFHRFGVIGGTALSVWLGVQTFGGPLPDLYVLLLMTLAGAMVGSFFLGLLLIDGINAARDAGDEPRFQRLHRADVALVGLGFLFGIALLVAIVYVLPGQFTFWPTAELTHG